MILINLLPHREMARKRMRQAFKALLIGAILFGILVSALIYLWYQGAISGQQERNGFLTAEIKKLDDEIKEIATLEAEIAALKARQEAVENLQSDRNLPVHLLNEMVKQLPEGIYLKSIKQENMNVLVNGLAQSNERVSEFLRNLSRNSEWIARPELIEIVAANVALSPREQRKAFDFTIRVQLQRASDAASAASRVASSGT